MDCFNEVFTTKNESETLKTAEEFSKLLKPGDVIAYKGNMGAGKTVFTRGIVRGLGGDDAVSSPTFAIVNEYIAGGLSIYHFDMYRIKSINDLYSTGYFDYLESGGIIIIEWSENIESAIPAGAYIINIETTDTNDNCRIITVTKKE
jgi:tRNA threonylcarbamoyladenosine biosynthesis protein TsaE